MNSGQVWQYKQEMRENTYLKRRLKELVLFIKLQERFACETEHDELGKKNLYYD